MSERRVVTRRDFVRGTAGAAVGGVAFFAHIGGFLSGAIVAFLLRRSGRVRPRVRDSLLEG